MLNVLLTNDDGIEAEGLQEMRRALVALDGVRLAVVAPDGNRSAMARSITTRRPLWVEEVPFSDGTVGYATDGTPVDCVRLASLGLAEGFEADLVVAGINHGANLGDDITYSGTVAAALEGVVLYEELGRALAPTPHFASAVLCGGALARAGSAAQQALEMAPEGVRVVSALHTVSAASLSELEHPLAQDVLVCGDSRADKRDAAGVIERIEGLRCVDCGRLEMARTTEAMTALLIAVNARYKTHAGVRLTGLPESLWE